MPIHNEAILPTVIISRKPDTAAELESLIADAERLVVVRKLTDIPKDINASRFLATLAPHIIFAEGDARELKPLVESISIEAPGVQVIALGSSLDRQIVVDLMHLGIREYLCYPFRASEVIDAIARCRAVLKDAPPAFRSTHDVFTFVPAKAGVGSSTIALNVSASIANEFGKRTLLADFDLTSGMQRFMMGLDERFSVVDAVERSAELDESLWPQLISSIGGLDILHSGTPRLNYRIEPAKILPMMDFARRNYDVIACDVSGNLEGYSIELMRQSKRIFLVSTPEMGALHMAREKLGLFRTLDMDERVNVIINRSSNAPNEIGPRDVERLIGRPAFFFFRNDYKEVSKSLKAGKPVPRDCAIGKCISGCAKRILELDREQATTTPRRKFIEYFRVAPRFVDHGPSSGVV